MFRTPYETPFETPFRGYQVVLRVLRVFIKLRRARKLSDTVLIPLETCWKHTLDNADHNIIFPNRTILFFDMTFDVQHPLRNAF